MTAGRDERFTPCVSSGGQAQRRRRGQLKIRVCADEQRDLCTGAAAMIERVPVVTSRRAGVVG
jgi:hypothetical protein